MVVTEWGRTTSARLLQPWKAFPPIVETDLPTTTLFSPEQLLNTDSPIVVTDLPMTRVSILEQLENELPPMVVTVLGIIILPDKLEQLWNAPPPIVTSPEWNTTSLKLLQPSYQYNVWKWP